MQCTPRLLRAPGIFKRTVEDLKRFAEIATTLQAITGPTKPYDLITFNDAESRERCKIMSDADQGGFSSVNLDHVPERDSDPAHIRFHGNISTQLPPDRPDIVRSGYAGWATIDRRPSLLGRSYWDIDPYTHLCLKVKSDGRKYFVNLRTDSIVPTDIHQHRLIARQPGKWETVVINLNDFVRTNGGEPVNPQSEMLKESVKSVGISLLDQIPKPYELCISRVWVTNEFRGDKEFDNDALHRPSDREDEELAKPIRRRSDGSEKILM